MRPTRRITLEFELDLLSPMGIGGTGRGADAEVAFVRDGSGRLVVPGTSIAGALRALLPAEDADRLFGTMEQASPLAVSDGMVARQETVVFRRTAIDRVTGAALESALFSFEALPPGSTIRFTATLDAASDDSEQEERLARLVALIEAGHLVLGRGKTTGWGRTAGRVVESRVVDLVGHAGPGELPAATDWTPPAVTTVGSERAKFRIIWRQLQPIMVRNGDSGVFDQMPIVWPTVDGKIRFVIPGSSLKGALRSRAEFIVRTVGLGPDRSASDRKDQIELPLVTHLFGTPARDEDHPPGAGAVRVHDCVSESELSAEKWEGLIHRALAAGEDDAVSGFTENGVQVDVVTHNAIDRWTGGVGDGLLFNSVEAHGVVWNPIELEIDQKRLGPEPGAAMGLLWLVLRDLEAGWVPLGGLVNRGFGQIAVSDIKGEGLATSEDGALAAWRAYAGERA